MIDLFHQYEHMQTMQPSHHKIDAEEDLWSVKGIDDAWRIDRAEVLASLPKGSGSLDGPVLIMIELAGNQSLKLQVGTDPDSSKSYFRPVVFLLLGLVGERFL